MFHFIKSIRQKLQSTGLAKKKLSKKNIEIINNFEIICLININKVNDYKKILLKELSKNSKLNK